MRKKEDSSEIQKSHKDATDEIEIELEVDGDESEKVTLEKEIADDLKEIVLEEESDKTSPKARTTPAVDNLSAGKKRPIQKKSGSCLGESRKHYDCWTNSIHLPEKLKTMIKQISGIFPHISQRSGSVLCMPEY